MTAELARYTLAMAVPCQVPVSMIPAEVRRNLRLPEADAVIKSRVSSTLRFNLAAPVAAPKPKLSVAVVNLTIVPSSVIPLVVTSVTAEAIVIFLSEVDRVTLLPATSSAVSLSVVLPTLMDLNDAGMTAEIVGF